MSANTIGALLGIGLSAMLMWAAWASTKLIQITESAGRADERTKDLEDKVFDHETRIRSLELGDYTY